MAQTFTANADQADIDAKYAQMTDGDTLNILPGTANWGHTWTISKRITVQGATTITGGGTLTPTINDNTTLVKTFSGPAIILAPTPAPSNFIATLSGLSIFDGTGGTEQNTQGILQITSSGDNSVPCTNVRVSQIHLKATGGSFKLGGWVYGVAFQCVTESTNATSIMSGQGEWNDGTHGNGSYSDFPHYGTEKAWFFEDCNFIRLGTPANSTSCNLDAVEGGRCVIRHCYWVACRPGWHGTEGSGTRGGRCYEIYNCTIDWRTNTGSFGSLQRSGSCLYHDNNFLGSKPQQNQHLTMEQYRSNGGVAATMTWGHSGGFSVFDKNVTENDGVSFVAGHAGHIFASGLASVQCGDGLANTSGPGTMILTCVLADGITDPNWAINQWAPASGIGFHINQNEPTNSSYPKSGIILSNTHNQITFSRYGASDRGILLWWRVGDAFKIGKCLVSMDGPGVGRTILYSTPRTADPVSPQAYSQAVIEPCLSWNNIHTPTGTTLNFTNSQPYVQQEGIHYFNLGVGHPTNGQIPASYTGPAYNVALNGEDYTGTYTYPHPLTVGSITPIITSAGSNSANKFVIGTANSFQVTTANFSAAPTFALSNIQGPGGVNTLPGSVTFATSGANAGKFTFSGSAGGEGNYNMTITASHTGDPNATQPFQLIIQTAVVSNQPPTCTITAPLNGATPSTTDTVTINVTATDVDSQITQVKFFDGALLLQTVTTVPYTINKVFSQGSHVLTAEATDNGTPPLTTVSSPVTINVQQVQGPPAAPNIAVLSS